MKHTFSTRRTSFVALVLPLALVVALSGCTLLGLGAVAGAAVGGCSVLDRNDDDTVTRAELSQGLFEAWDTNDNGTLTEAEFEAGIDRRDTFDGWSGDFDDWDSNGNGTLSQAEFDAGVDADGSTRAWLDDQCDDLGL